MRQFGFEIFLQCNCVVVFLVVRAVDERDLPLSFRVPQWLQRLLVRIQFRKVPAAELLPLRRIMAQPLAQFGAGRDLPHLNVVSRMRVAINRSGSKGALAMEKARVLPPASVSGGFISVRSIDWPARNRKSLGFAKWNAIVPSAISSYFFRLDIWVDAAVGIAPFSGSEHARFQRCDEDLANTYRCTIYITPGWFLIQPTECYVSRIFRSASRAIVMVLGGRPESSSSATVLVPKPGMSRV